jgi:hypothetical protein
MLLSQERDPIISNGLGAGNNFTIAASPKAFEVLSSNLYQDKVLAVIREISCNAADAHTSVGKPLSDIQVHLPSFSEPYFSVRDFGPGLAQADVMELYTTYFRSTKDHSNDLIGGFGLGSKSPFAVADQFTVTSWHKGTKTQYICYKEDGLPRVNFVASSSSTEPSGLEVRVATKSTADWSSKASNYYQWWPELPTICNASHLRIESLSSRLAFKSETTLNGLPTWGILKNFQAPIILVGLVPYALNVEMLRPYLGDEVFKIISGGSIFINVPIGFVEISPSREALSYNRATIDFLKEACNKVAREIVLTASKEIDAQPTLFEARRFIFGPTSHSSNYLIESLRRIASSGKLKWRNKTLGHYINLDLPNDFSAPATVTHYQKRYHWVNFQKSLTSTNQHTFQSGYVCQDDLHLVWAPKLTGGLYSKLRHNYLNPAQGKQELNFYIFTGMPFSELEAYCQDKGLPDPVNADDLEEAPKAESSPNATPKTQGYVFTFEDNSINYERTTTPLNLAGGGLYIRFMDGHPMGNARTQFSMLRRAGLIPDNIRLVGISSSTLKTKRVQQMLALHGWQEFNSTWTAANITDKQVYDRALTVRLTRELLGQYAGFLNEFRSAMSGQKILPGAEKFIKLLTTHFPAGPLSSPYGEANPLGQWASPTQQQALDKVETYMQDLQTAWKEFLAAHPMLNYTDMARLPKHIFNDYINR